MIEERLAEDPNDEIALTAKSDARMAERDLEGLVDVNKRLDAIGKLGPAMLNNQAWIALLLDNLDDAAVKAIERAVRLARPDETILVAGKGHEAYQDFGDTVVPFDDREHARRAMERFGPAGQESR